MVMATVMAAGGDNDEYYLPRGYIFSPSDRQLLEDYLFNKINGYEHYQGSVFECDLYGHSEPWEIWECFGGGDDQDLYFFTKLKRSTNNSGQLSAHITRKVGLADGTWSGENSPTPIFSIKYQMEEFGYWKRFRYENARLPEHHGEWIMYEYSLHEDCIRDGADPNYVLCRIKKNERRKKKGSKRCYSETLQSAEQTVVAPEMIYNSPRRLRMTTDQDTSGVLWVPEMAAHEGTSDASYLPFITATQDTSGVPYMPTKTTDEGTSRVLCLPEMTTNEGISDLSYLLEMTTNEDTDHVLSMPNTTVNQSISDMPEMTTNEGTSDVSYLLEMTTNEDAGDHVFYMPDTTANQSISDVPEMTTNEGTIDVSYLLEMTTNEDAGDHVFYMPDTTANQSISDVPEMTTNEGTSDVSYLLQMTTNEDAGDHVLYMPDTTANQSINDVPKMIIDEKTALEEWKALLNFDNLNDIVDF